MLYESYVDQRPPGWLTNGPAALMLLAHRGDGNSLRGSTACLLYLAKHMRAADLQHDPARLERMTLRAQRRRRPPPTPLAFRTGDWRVPRLETAETRRQLVRDQLLLAGDDARPWPNAELALLVRYLVRCLVRSVAHALGRFSVRFLVRHQGPGQSTDP